MKTTALAVALVGALAGTASATPPGMTPITVVPELEADEPEGTPPISGGRLVGEFLLGGMAGVVGGIGGAYIGYGLETSGGCNDEWCGIGGLILGGIAGYTLAAPLAVYAVGSSGNETGSLGWTYGGSLIGAGFGLMMLASESEAGVMLGLAAPVIGSMIGFNATRRYEAKPRERRMWAPTASVSSRVSTFGIAGHF